MSIPIVLNTQLSTNQCNADHDFLLLEVSAISHHFELLANKSQV